MDDAKKWLWVHVIFFAFIFVGLFLSFYLRDSYEAQFSLFREPKELTEGRNQVSNISSKMFQWLMNMGLCDPMRRWWSSKEEKFVPETHDKPDPIVISPNLSSCHPSIDHGFPVSCCPPKLESEEHFIDFQIPSPSSVARIRRPAHLVDDDFLAKYSKAIKIMKSLPFKDPRSFKRQYDMHCIYCSGAYNQKFSNTILMVHHNWLFYAWHRMYIYFHERILGNLIRDDTFALPFWNWDAPQGMVIPKWFMEEPFLNMDRDKSHLSPKVVDSSYPEYETGLGPDDQIAQNLALMYNQMVSGSKKPELFMGCPYKVGKAGYCKGSGAIELAPHGTLHRWVGSNLNPMREDMGAVYVSARDPTFYAHHSNIDRLWEVWKEMRGYNEYKTEITDPRYLDSYFFFHDENAQLVRIKIRDVLNITKLGYSFEKVDNPWLNARPKPSVSPKFARQKLDLIHNVNGIINLPSNNYSSNFGPMGRVLDSTFTSKIHRPKRERTKAEKEVEEEVLVVYGIDVKRDMGVKFDVYVNAIDGNGIGPESREYAGCYVNVPRGITFVRNKDDVVMSTKSYLKLGITELLEDLEADGDESIWVTIVPRGGTGVNITIDGIRIDYIV